MRFEPATFFNYKRYKDAVCFRFVFCLLFSKISGIV